MSVAWVEVSKDALLHNVRQLRSLYPEAKVAAVVKGNAYGHGQPEVTSILEEEVEYWQVDDLDELRLLRKSSQKPTLLLGYVPIDDLEEAVALDSILALYDEARLEPLQRVTEKLSKPAKVHLKIDTFLGRQGILPSELPGMMEKLHGCPGIQVLGAYTHFANIEDTTDFTHAQAQVNLYEEALRALSQGGFTNLQRHISSTSGLMAYETTAKVNDLVRLGIGLYGLYPSEALGKSFEGLSLRPAMRWVTKLAQVKTLPAGHPVGYGLTYVTWREMRVGIVPQGYADGYDRGLSNASQVLVRGVRCPVIGRIAMNMFAIDLSSVPDAAQEDEVVLLGSQGTARITAEEIARRIGTINYEVGARVSPLLGRRVTT